MILGERYRFGPQGFDYPTGGAGTLINRRALKILAKKCSCPRPDAPDDMVLGKCIQDFQIVFVHARPQDYAPDRLATDDAVTFHKHWMIDPVQVYQRWFLAEDQQLQVGPFRTEL
ncbi:hypothetical protein D910_08967 [Dendroctonus ponderosae]|uniref:Fringe-like glycosyltransferase domain-containing protein n=1 Tax=Dendroctonus ponderosae TaxID=77166 RepID=U4UH01_DENPD|nr:hypothetical protein D910_08967 [Dendroctonus ponderosae]